MDPFGPGHPDAGRGYPPAVPAPPVRRPGPSGLFLTPGAGSDRDHPGLVALQDRLAPLAVERMDFPYRKAGKPFPDRAPALLEAVRDGVAAMAVGHDLDPDRLVLGGRSMGGRMCSMAVAEGLPAVGLVLVFAYCLFYYRLLGILTILSLALSGLVVYAVLILLGRWIGFTLDLAGGAGFIIAIGITADSFVIFFERLKDEMREGRTFRSAVPRSWERARRTILTADAVSFLAAAVLYILAVGEVRGFAFTLGMSTGLDLVVVFLVTFPLVVLISRSRSLGRPGLSGLGAVDRIGSRHRRAKPAVGRRAATTGKGAGA